MLEVQGWADAALPHAAEMATAWLRCTVVGLDGESSQVFTCFIVSRLLVGVYTDSVVIHVLSRRLMTDRCGCGTTATAVRRTSGGHSTTCGRI